MPRSLISTSQNYMAQSKGASGWSVNTGITLTANTTDILDPFGGHGATKVVYDGSGSAGAFRLFMSSIISPRYLGTNYTTSLWICLASGTRPMILNTNTFGPTSFTATTSWQRISSTALWTSPASSVVLDLFDGVGQNSAFTFYVYGPQANIANYALPYTETNGSAVTNGVRNQVANRQNTSNRVLIPKSQNYVLQSNTFNNATWTNTATVATSASQDPFNGSNAWDVTDSSAVAFQNLVQNIALGNPGTYNCSIFIKKTSSATILCGFNLSGTGITTLNARFNTNTGAITGTNSGSAINFNSNWWLFVFPFTVTSLSPTLSLNFFPATGPTSGGDQASATGTQTIYNCQIVKANWQGPLTITTNSAINTGALRNLIANT